MPQDTIFGIDLGTTYSCVASCDESGKPVVLPNLEGDMTTPSVVYFESDANIIVGKEAKNVSKAFPDRVADFIKRQMGSAEFRFDVDGRSYTPEQVSSLILRKVAQDAEQAAGAPVRDVVITCPAYFGNNEREATRRAGELAGLNVVGIINEPTAAAICYGLNNAGTRKTVLVYDLGGGTFDVTVIAVENDDVTVICTGGNHQLGGKDWDERLVDWFAEQFVRQQPDAGDPRYDSTSMQSLMVAAEEAKKSLTAKEKTSQTLTHAGKSARIELTRPEFEEITRDLLEQTVTLTRDVLEQARGRHIDELLLVGGSSKMPAVARRVKDAFQLEGRLFDPDQAVAKGAAQYGRLKQMGNIVREILASKKGVDAREIDLEKIDEAALAKAAAEAAAANPDFRMTASEIQRAVKVRIKNVCSHAFGIVALCDGNDQVCHLIRQNTELPASVTQNFYTVVDRQEQLHVRIREQSGRVESERLDDNREIKDGFLELSGDQPKGSPVTVTFAMGDDGTLDVSARDPKSGHEIKLQVKVDAVQQVEVLEKQRAELMALSVS